MPHRPSVLLLADDFNPEWPSLPIVAFKYARALSRYADVTVATHVRNRENIEKLGLTEPKVAYLNNEYIASPMHKASTFLRGGNEVAWSTNMIMSYLPYLFFEYEVWKAFKEDLASGRFDIVHRTTPMSPTMPSYIAGKPKQPFVLGPLNGNLPWPKEFTSEQRREKELLRALRNAYKLLPYTRSGFKNSALILAGFDHTIDDLPKAVRDKTLNFPEVGFDDDIFHSRDRCAPFGANEPLEFLFAGRLVPYKLPEVVVRAFVQSEGLRPHRLRVLGDGPEMQRLKQIVADAAAEDRVVFDGNVPQATVAQRMRESDAFVFPSVRELGAGVVIEAMACGTLVICADYGAPGHLTADNRGVAVPLSDREQMVSGITAAMEWATENREDAQRRAAAGHRHAHEMYTWDEKAKATVSLYEDLLNKRPFRPLHSYP